MRLAALLVLTAAVASAADPQLTALHQTLSKLASHSLEEIGKNSGAFPELTTAKHQLRDWIEQQLASFKDLPDLAKAEGQINELLKPVGIPGAKPQGSQFGDLGPVRLTRESGILIVTTGVGILCQQDESAYAYRFTDGHWNRIWQSEQTDYDSHRYKPQFIPTVHVWQRWDEGRPQPLFIMTLGHEWGCASNWHTVYYRVWRVDPSGSKLLINGSGWAFLRTFTYAVGSISQSDFPKDSPVDVLVEFTQGSIDAGVHNREAVFHYLIDKDHVQRVAPVALSPRDFVDEWLTTSWNESAAWSAAPALQSWHRKLQRDAAGGEFDYPTLKCQSPDHRQVGLVPSNPKTFEDEPEVYFLVRWTPPYHFQMVEVGNKPSPHCTQKDPEADAWRTLFNTQEWRQ